MYPWKDWHEWVHVYHLLFENMGIVVQSSHTDKEVNLLATKNEGSLKIAQGIISGWLLKNVGGDQSKFLKMQKLLLIQTLSLIRLSRSEESTERMDFVAMDDQQMALNFRLIQLIEMGAKTAEYKKSKQGGKLSMKSVAAELGFPVFLVQLRHQTVHEQGTLLSNEVMVKAVTRL